MNTLGGDTAPDQVVTLKQRNRVSEDPIDVRF
jgi:hypothetical protein